MKITMLGTGTGLIRPERSSPAVLLETEGDSVIIDCGWGVPQALNTIRFPLHTLGHLAISHRHADHISALPSLLQSQHIANIKHLPGEPRRDALILHGYSGIKYDLEILCAMMIPEFEIEKELTIVEHGQGESHQSGSLRVAATSVRHVDSMPSVSFCFEAKGKKVVITGDMGWDETILPQLQDAAIAVMDASASQHEYQMQPIRSHLAPIQCGELAAKANVKHLILTSLYDREPRESILAAVRKHFRGTITIPHDLQTFEL